MRTIAPVIALMTALIAPAFAQKAEIEAVNAKWIDFFNKGDFAGVASLYTDDATGFRRVRHGEGQSRDRGTVEKHGGAGQRSETHNPRRQATRALRGARDRDLQPQDQGADAAGSRRQISRGVGEDRKRLEACRRYLERRQVGARIRNVSVCAPTRRSNDLKPVGRLLQCMSQLMGHVASHFECLCRRQLEKLQLGTLQVNARMALLWSPKIGAGEPPRAL